MKKIFLLIAIFTFSLVKGQNKLELGIKFTPVMSQRVYKNASTKLDHGLTSGFGISSIWTINKITLQTGLSYLPKQELIKDMLDTRSIVDENGKIDYSRVEYYDWIKSHRFINLPILVSYNVISNNKINSGPILGFELNYLFQQKLSIKLSDQNIEDITDHNEIEEHIHIGSMLGMSFKYIINENMNILFQPFYSIGLTSKVVFHSIGANFLITYTFPNNS